MHTAVSLCHCFLLTLFLCSSTSSPESPVLWEKNQTNPAPACGSPQAAIPSGAPTCSCLSPPQAAGSISSTTQHTSPSPSDLGVPSVGLCCWSGVFFPPLLYLSGMFCPSLNTFLQKCPPHGWGAQPCPAAGRQAGTGCVRLGAARAAPHRGHAAAPRCWHPGTYSGYTMHPETQTCAWQKDSLLSNEMSTSMTGVSWFVTSNDGFLT